MTVYRRVESRFGGDSKDGLAEVRETALFFAEARELAFFGGGSKDGVAKIWERVLQKTAGSCAVLKE